MAEEIRFKKVSKVETEMDTEGNEYFYFNGKHYLKDFIRCHNNPWISDVFPEWLDAVEIENYYNPMGIRYDSRSEMVIVYESEVA